VSLDSTTLAIEKNREGEADYHVSVKNNASVISIYVDVKRTDGETKEDLIECEDLDSYLGYGGAANVTIRGVTLLRQVVKDMVHEKFPPRYRYVESEDDDYDIDDDESDFDGVGFLGGALIDY